MRDLKRIDRILRKLGELWRRVPDQRFGQFVDNYIIPSGLPAYQLGPLRFEEDDVVEARIDATIAAIQEGKNPLSEMGFRMSREERDASLRGETVEEPAGEKMVKGVFRDALDEENEGETE